MSAPVRENPRIALKARPTVSKLSQYQQKLLLYPLTQVLPI